MSPAFQKGEGSAGTSVASAITDFASWSTSVSNGSDAGL